MKTILVILITSLCWALGLYFYGDKLLYPQEEVVEVAEEVAATPAPQKTAAKKVVATKPKTPAKNYAKLICGNWSPVEGTECRLEISKYGTVTRHYKLHSSSDLWYDDRYDYTISGNKLVVNGHYKCTVNVFEEGGVTYLEIFGHEDYAGKYRKR